jgi:hypothetical protein
MTKYADDPSTEAARKMLEQDRKVLEKIRSDYAMRSKGKPTPTQEELDMAKLGAHIIEHEDDGGGPDPYDPVHRQLEGEQSTAKPQAYQTRQTKPA